MVNLKSKKRALLQGASTLFMLGAASAAFGQSVTTSDSAIALDAGVDATTVVDLLKTGAGTTATANNTAVLIGDTDTPNEVSGTSVLINTASVTANSVNNVSTASLSDSGAAATSTSGGISVKQDNQASALAQTGAGTNADATTVDGTQVKIAADATTDSSLTISDATNRSTATGNSASTAISDTDFTTNSTSATLATLQGNTGEADVTVNDVTTINNISITAKVNDTDIKLTTGLTSGSDLTITGNTDAATATANSVTQQMTLDGTMLTLGTDSATANTAPSTATTADSDATGSALVSSRQTNTFADVDATNSASSIQLNSGVTAGSALEVSKNLQEANATGSSAGNTLALSGNAVGTGAAIVSTQSSDAASEVDARTTGAAAITATSLSATADDLGSSASLTDNKLQSRATGGSVTNALTVSATSIALKAPDAVESAIISKSDATADNSLTGTVSAGYATLNDQRIAGDVTATTSATSDSAGFTVSTGAVKNGSSINNDRNAMTAQAQGALAANSTTLTVGGTLSQADATIDEGVANGAVIANIQELANGTDVAARVETTAAPALLTEVDGALTSSSVSTSNNKVQALADGAAATNAMTVSATTLSTAAVTGGDLDAGAAMSSVNTTNNTTTADSAFAVVNRQSGGNGTIAAELNDPISVLTAITGITTGSSVTSAGNMQDAFATSNKATNSLALSATTLTGDGAVVNAQNSAAQVSSLIGATATPAGVIVDFNNTIENSAVAVTGNMVRGSAISNVGNNTLTVAATTLTGGGTEVQAVADSDNTTTTADFSLGNWQNLDGAASSDTQIYATFGVDQRFDQSMDNSQVAVSNNVQFGEALGNSANNKVQLTALGAGSGTGTDPTAALNNVQSGETADIASTSEMTLYSNIASSGSSIAINGNSNTALAAVNNANNTMGISGTTVDGSDSTVASVDVGDSATTAAYALNNSQSASGLLTSTALTEAYNLDIEDVNIAADDPDPAAYATSGILNGSATLSKNTTTAEASANRVANSLAVSATNNGATAAIGNEQSSAAEVTAIASDSYYSLELEASDAAAASGGTDYAASGSSLAIDGNTTNALARGNSASNALNYTVGVNYTGTSTGPSIVAPTVASGVVTDGYASAEALILNSQSNTNLVSAQASSVKYSLALSDGLAGAALNSSATIGNNTTTAVAYGNSVNNSLTMSTFGSAIPSSAIANNQSNSGPVTAEALNVGYSLALNGGTTISGDLTTSAENSSATVGNNTTAAVAYGNSANNSLTMASFSAGIPSSALANSQVNSGAVTATATGVAFAMTPNGPASGSAFRNSGNTVTAQAVGNSSVSTIGGGAM